MEGYEMIYGAKDVLSILIIDLFSVCEILDIYSKLKILEEKYLL